MTKKEAIQAMLEGKKITADDWHSGEYIYFNEDGSFVNQRGNEANLNGCKSLEYKEYIELVDWNTAYNHMSNGGIVKYISTSDIVYMYKIINEYLYVKDTTNRDLRWELSVRQYNNLISFKFQLLEREDDED